MKYPQYRSPEDRYREMKHERSIRDWFAERPIEDPDFTHCITINFDRDIAYVSESMQRNFLSSFRIAMQSICLDRTPRQVKKLPPEQQMKFRCIAEDYEKVTSIRAARHFNIQAGMSLLDVKMNRFRIKHEANRLARRILRANVCNFHVQELPEQKCQRRERVAYDYKNGFRPNSFDRMKTERDFIRTREKKEDCISASQ